MDHEEISEEASVTHSLHRQIIAPLISSINATFGSEAGTICAFWWDNVKNNWGDALNPIIIKALSGKKPVQMTNHTLNVRQRPVYIVIGSILDTNLISRSLFKDLVVWGPGFISASGRLFDVPKEICAVRGPLTRDRIIKQGIKCPEIYGDPALLYPKIYRPKVYLKYQLGIIPHYIDKNSDFLKYLQISPDVKIIDIEGPINDVVDEICSCRYIASSSLHGIIAADAYGIPSAWIKLSDNVMGSGFKFYDYFESVGRADEQPLIITGKTTIDDILGTYHNYKLDIDLDALLEACPFYDEKIKLR